MWFIPKADIEGVDFLDNQFIPFRVLFNILLDIQCQVVLVFHLLCDDFPSVSLEIGP